MILGVSKPCVLSRGYQIRRTSRAHPAQKIRSIRAPNPIIFPPRRRTQLHPAGTPAQTPIRMDTCTYLHIPPLSSASVPTVPSSRFYLPHPRRSLHQELAHFRLVLPILGLLEYPVTSRGRKLSHLPSLVPTVPIFSFFHLCSLFDSPLQQIASVRRPSLEPACPSITHAPLPPASYIPLEPF